MRKIFLLIPAVLFSFVLQAQGLKFGVFVDPQISFLFPDAKNVEGDGIHFGINGGLIMDNYFQENYAFSTGISLGGQGGTLQFLEKTPIKVYKETDTIPAGSSVEYKLRYITIPLGLKLRTNQIGYMSYYAQLGFSGQINIRAKGSVSGTDINNDNISEEVNLFNVGYHFGGGLEYAIAGESALTFGVIYTNGFIDIFKSPNGKTTTGVLSFRLGVIF